MRRFLTLLTLTQLLFPWVPSYVRLVRRRPERPGACLKSHELQYKFISDDEEEVDGETALKLGTA